MKCQASLTQIPCLMLEKTFCVVLSNFSRTESSPWNSIYTLKFAICCFTMDTIKKQLHHACKIAFNINNPTTGFLPYTLKRAKS